MLDKSDLQAIADLMDAKLKPISERLNSIDDRLSNLEEDSKVTRASVNTLLDWAEDAQIEVKIPLYKKAQ